MNLVMAIVCLVVLAAIGVRALINIFTRKDDVLSWTSLFLVGYAHFVCLSGFFVGAYDIGALRRGGITDRSVSWYALLVPLFLIVFLLSAGWARRRSVMARIFPKVELPITSPGILSAIAAMLLVGGIAAIAPPDNFLGLILVQVRGGLAPAAAGLATYYLMASRFNPLAWAVFIGAFAFAVLVSFSGSIGRRDLVATLLAVPMMWYFMSLRYRSGGRILAIIGPATLLGIVAVAFLTTIRFQGVTGNAVPTAGDRANQIVELLTNPRFSTAAVEAMLYTDTAGNTMWIIDQYPETFDFAPLSTAYWILVNPIPRSIFPGKPEALGIILSEQMGRQENLGPGIIGQSWYEGGLLAVLIFAVVWGVAYGSADRALRDRCWNPYAVAMLSAPAGNVLSMPRGDIGLFAIQVAGAVIGVAVVLTLCRVALIGWASAFPPLLLHHHAQASSGEPDPSDSAGDDSDHELDNPPPA